jgi:hypothetical protein
MIKKFVILTKYLSVILGVLVVVISCEKDFKNVGVNLVDNNVFSTDKYTSEIIAYSKNIEVNKTDYLTYYLLGTAEDGNFGKLNASVVSQLGLAEENPDFGENAVIDSVILNIPLDATLLRKYEVPDPENPNEVIIVPEFELDSVWGNGDNSFLLKIHELGTFLNIKDPADPTQNMEYFSNTPFDKLQELYNDVVSPSVSDTMSIIKRTKYIDDTFSTQEVYSYDTIKNTNSEPSLIIPLEKQFFLDNFLNDPISSHFSSNSDFQHYFRGLYLEAFNAGVGSTLMALQLSNAKMTVYYTDTSFPNEGAEEDLNGNGIKGEGIVQVIKTGIFACPFSGIKVNLFDRDYSGALAENYINNPNTTVGNDKIFVQGATGSDGVIHLFGEDTDSNDIPDELEALQTKNWLINDAQLHLYVDTENTTNTVPNQLYLYNIGEDENYQSYEIMHQGPSVIGGLLENDTDGNPVRYTFHITDYISEIIKTDSDVPLAVFGIKTYDINDKANSSIDTIMRKYNNIHKGVVLTGNIPNTEENRIKLEIFYTEKNN